jgi:single-strand DNA-binding protein
VFITCVLWGRDGILPWLAKGKKVSCTGSLRQREWQAQDGGKRSVIEYVLRDIDPFFANPKGEVRETQPTPAPAGAMPADDSYDIPFAPSVI